jgi:DNA invertase Pin-like site-specific DNA recombinase
MIAGANHKVSASHLKRDAYLYVRQSTIQQVFENTKSSRRQYALRQRAVALGWSLERIQVIDCDSGQSGASAADREGFKRLVTEVSLGNAGIVLGLEVSRLARNCTDWHRLLEICALSDTLILDEDGLYNPNDFNDRLLLGMKGTMSEAELHLLRARLQGGKLNKARRGELCLPLPVGFVYDDQRKVRLDPDAQVRETVASFFQAFRRTGSAFATLKYFREQKILFPRRLRTGVGKGELLWGQLTFSRVLQILHNPRYAGVFFYGRSRTRKDACGRRTSQLLPRDEWQVMIPQAHEGYISWSEYEDNQRRLRNNSLAHGSDGRKSPPREGPALLQGLILCGLCGRRMTVRYYTRNNRLQPTYVCQGEGIHTGKPICQSIPGYKIDQAVGELILKTLTPLTLEVALAVQQELSNRLDEADRLRAKQVERARYEAELAKRRYLQVDPDNRLVADALEADWNEKLRSLRDAQEEYERQREADRMLVGDEERAKIMALATDFPELWNDPKVQPRERKRMIRLLVEDVTLSKIKGESILVHVCFKGGATSSLTLPAPKFSWEIVQTPPEVVKEIDRLLDHNTYGQIAAILNEAGFSPGRGESFHPRMIGRIRRDYNLKHRYQRLREAGKLTAEEMAKLLKVNPQTVKIWWRNGLLQGYSYNDKNECLYEPPGPDAPVKTQGSDLSKRSRFPKPILKGHNQPFEGGAV